MRQPFIINRSGKLVKRRHFNVIDRAVWKAKQEIMVREDAAIFALLDKSIFEITYVSDIEGSGNNEE